MYFDKFLLLENVELCIWNKGSDLDACRLILQTIHLAGWLIVHDLNAWNSASI